jgi:hypothetical protein
MVRLLVGLLECLDFALGGTRLVAGFLFPIEVRTNLSALGAASLAGETRLDIGYPRADLAL